MKRFEQIIERFSECSIGVIGDSAADIYILGKPERISREAPVMVVRKEEERLIPGCAANTVNNLIALDCRVLPVTLVGDDDHGKALKNHFESRAVEMEGVLTSSAHRTVTKTRIMVGDANRIKHQVIRIDDEAQLRIPASAVTASANEEKRIVEAVESLDSRVQAWLVSDYDCGLVSDRVIECLLRIAGEKPVIVDSRYRLNLFRGVCCLTPNEEEAAMTSGIAIRSDEDVEKAGRELLSRLRAQTLVITRGNKGMMLFEESGDITRIPALGEEEVVDVSGAGDTVAATIALSLVAGASSREGAELANCAASVVVMKTGAATCSRDELKSRLRMLRLRPS